MAPVLFLFLMTAFAESLDKEYDRNNIKKIDLHQASDEDFANGNAILKSHKPKQYLSTGKNEPKLTYWEAMLFLCRQWSIPICNLGGDDLRSNSNI
jgi:hypothetical protein